jgi:hypothetical protein
MARALPWPVVQTYIYEAISKQPGIAHQTMLEQWNNLIVKPQWTARDRQSLPYSTLFVINALDECDSQQDVKLIL